MQVYTYQWSNLAYQVIHDTHAPVHVTSHHGYRPYYRNQSRPTELVIFLNQH